MNIKRGRIKATDLYELSNTDRLKIESKYGYTKIFINDKEIHFVLSYKVTQSVNKNIILKITRLVEYGELEKMLKSK